MAAYNSAKPIQYGETLYDLAKLIRFGETLKGGNSWRLGAIEGDMGKRILAIRHPEATSRKQKGG